MTDLGIIDVGTAVQNISVRVADLEQVVTSADVMTGPLTNNFPAGIIVSTNPVDTVCSPPTGGVEVLGTYYGNVYVDLSWTAPVDASAASYQVEIAKKISGVYQPSQIGRTGGVNFRFSNLDPNTTYGARTYSINRLGIVSTPLPAMGFLDFTTGMDGTIPAGVVGLALSAGYKSVVATWTANTDPDVINGAGTYEFQLDTTNTFNSVAGAPLYDKIFGGNLGGVDGLTGSTLYYSRVRAIDASGNAGAWSSTVSATTGLVNGGTDITVGTITADRIVAFSLTSAQIQAGSITGDRITSNTIDVVKLISSTLTSKTITIGSGGNLQTSLYPGLVINSQGLSLYNGSAVRTVYLDATTGTGTFTGAISGGTITGTTISGGTITGSILQTLTYNNQYLTIYGSNSAYPYLAFHDLSGNMSFTGSSSSFQFSASASGGPLLSMNTSGINLTWASPGQAFNIDAGGNGIRLTASYGYSMVKLLTTTAKVQIRNYTDSAYGDFAAANGTFTGTLTAGVKPFAIPHPVKGVDHVLVHSVIEAPQADLYYRGRAKLVRGKARVNLDKTFGMTAGTFEALTRDTQFLLYNETSSDHPTATLEGANLVISCDDQTASISWVVIGERKDDTMKASYFTDDEGKILTEHKIKVLHDAMGHDPSLDEDLALVKQKR